ncbi:MAG: cell division protein FtsB [Zoogloeaceae bacterium]|jgi:cell division protein FtsB|nr:cell division protein FtsB [Zoogloeaceae bacterium]
MRRFTFALLALLLLLQYPLWFGKGGWLKVWEYDRQLKQHKEASRQLEIRNSGMDAEVRDLKTGYEAIEERARFELGMIKSGEAFIPFPENGGQEHKDSEAADADAPQ